jgi:hypothetical protein
MKIEPLIHLFLLSGTHIHTSKTTAIPFLQPQHHSSSSPRSRAYTPNAPRYYLDTRESHSRRTACGTPHNAGPHL